MITIDVEKLHRYSDLKEKYAEKYKELKLPNYVLFPKEFFDIGDYDIQSDLIEQALAQNKRLEELEYIRKIHFADLERRITDNIDTATAKRFK